jgi:uncharacterized heparinase superfamily protein
MLFIKYFNTLRYLYSYQIFGRILYNFKRHLGLIRHRNSPQNIQYTLTTTIPFLIHNPWNDTIDIKRGNIRFLNKTLNAGMPVSWDHAQASLLWKYNLHYFQYLFHIYPDLQVELCRQWIRSHTLHTGIGWNPYPLSLRIVNWIKAEITEPDILNSLYEQASYLYRSIEYFYSGNHLLENARALIFAGTFFGRQGESTKWKKTGMEILREELPKQVLSDGGFYERSPMYHALILEAVLDVINILETEHPDRNLLEQTAQRMSDFLISITHPTGKIALFNDATEEIAPPVNSLISYTDSLLSYAPRKKREFPDTGYFIIDDDPVYCIIDGGPAGPDHLLAHAHADIFSYELSLHGQKCIVDTGVYEYESGEMRTYVRSTKAHNTVSIDGIDQIECWDSFRVARRFKPYNVSFNESFDNTEFMGSFDGYSRLIGDNIIHTRSMRHYRQNRIIEVIDNVTGSGNHLVESSIHLHPHITVIKIDTGYELLINNVKYFIRTDNNSKLETGWYCPEFGLKHKNSVIIIGGRLNLPVALTYTVYY